MEHRGPFAGRFERDAALEVEVAVVDQARVERVHVAKQTPRVVRRELEQPAEPRALPQELIVLRQVLAESERARKAATLRLSAQILQLAERIEHRAPFAHP